MTSYLFIYIFCVIGWMGTNITVGKNGRQLHGLPKLTFCICWPLVLSGVIVGITLVVSFLVAVLPIAGFVRLITGRA